MEDRHLKAFMKIFSYAMNCARSEIGKGDPTKPTTDAQRQAMAFVQFGTEAFCDDATTDRELAMFVTGFFAQGLILSHHSGKCPQDLLDAVLKASELQGERAKNKAKLTAEQYDGVSSVIDRECDRGMSETQACKNVAAQLATGTFEQLPGLRVEITADAIKKQRQKRSRV